MKWSSLLKRLSAISRPQTGSLSRLAAKRGFFIVLLSGIVLLSLLFFSWSGLLKQDINHRLNTNIALTSTQLTPNITTKQLDAQLDDLLGYIASVPYVSQIQYRIGEQAYVYTNGINQSLNTSQNPPLISSRTLFWADYFSQTKNYQLSEVSQSRGAVSLSFKLNWSLLYGVLFLRWLTWTLLMVLISIGAAWLVYRWCENNISKQLRQITSAIKNPRNVQNAQNEHTVDISASMINQNTLAADDSIKAPSTKALLHLYRNDELHSLNQAVADFIENNNLQQNKQAWLIKELQQQVDFDELTGLQNRNRILQSLRAAKQHQQQDTWHVLLFVAIDNHQSIKQSAGLQFSDVVLQVMAARLRGYADEMQIRKDINIDVGRFGEEEFILIFKVVDADEKQARLFGTQIVADIKNLFAKPLDIQGKQQSIFITTGGAVFDVGDGSKDNTAMEQAFDAILRDKHTLKSGCSLWNDSFDTELGRHQRLQNQIENGLRNDEFFINLQPIYFLPDLEIRSYEILLRWQHPEEGLIAPSDFIKMAEHSDITHELFLFVLKQSAATIEQWKTTNIWRPGMRLNINVSPAQFYRHDLALFLATNLQRYGLLAEDITLEINERVLARNEQSALKVLKEVRALGVHIMLGGFGSGYADLTTLEHLPIDGLKLSKDFIKNIDADKQARSVVGSLLAISRARNLSCVVEGIETEQQAEIVELMGNHGVQGYYYGKPMSVDQAANLLDSWRPLWVIN